MITRIELAYILQNELDKATYERLKHLKSADSKEDEDIKDCSYRAIRNLWFRLQLNRP